MSPRVRLSPRQPRGPLARLRSLRTCHRHATARLAVWILHHPLVVPIALALVLTSLDALARPGGGQSFSGGSRSGGSSSGSSSGSSGGGGDILGAILGFLFELLLQALFELLFQLTVTYPKVMVPIWIAVVVIPIVFSVTSRWLRERGWTTGKQDDPADGKTTDGKTTDETGKKPVDTSDTRT